MKKSLLLLASLLMSVASFAQWTKPVPATETSFKYSEFVAEEGDTAVYYLYNKEAGAFFNEGLSQWGTQAGILNTGLKVAITKYISTEEEGMEWDGKTVLINDYSEVKKAWKVLFADSETACFVDRGNQANYFWEIEEQGAGTYRIKCASINPTLNPASYPNCYFGVSYLNDANNTAIWPLIDATEDTGAHLNWAFVSEEAYAAYYEKVVVYNAAEALKKVIEKAKAEYPTVKTADAEAVYNNTSSTLEDLNAAKAAINDAIKEVEFGQASEENPLDVTEWLQNPSFDGNVNGWTNTFVSGTNATNIGYQGANYTNGEVRIDKFMEAWSNAKYKTGFDYRAIGAGKLSQTIENMPKGKYKFAVDCIANNQDGQNPVVGVQLFATGGDVDINKKVATGNGLPEHFEIVFVNAGDAIEMGIRTTEECTANWIAVDNFTLTYFGPTSEDPMKIVLDAAIAEAEEVYPVDGLDDVKAYKGDKDAYKSTIEAAKSATADFEAQIDAVAEAKKTLAASAEAYAAYNKEVAEISDYLNNHSDMAGDEVDYLADYTMEDELEPDDDYPFGNALYINNNLQVTPEDIAGETTRIKELLQSAIVNSLYPGKDCTDMLVNPDFSAGDKTGWTVNINPTNFAWTGGLIPNAPVCESWHSKFDISQEVTGVPDGIYSISLNGFCRLDDGVDTSVPAEVYLNTFSTPLMNLQDDPISKEDAVDGINAYLTNGDTGAWTSNPLFEGAKRQSPADQVDSEFEGGWIPNGMEGASVAFSAGRYKATAYGIVEGGKMTIGVRNTKSVNVWALWGNFKLTYEGKSKEAVDALAKSYEEIATNYLDNNQGDMSDPAIDAIDAAIKAIKNASTTDEKYDAILAVNEALNAGAENVEAVGKFNTAKENMDNAASQYGSEASDDAIKAYEEVSDVTYNSLTTEEILAYVPKFDEVTAALKVPATDDASDDNPVDMTRTIVNADIEAGADTGWTYTKNGGNGPALASGIDGASIEFWNEKAENLQFNIWQELKNAPEGTYTLGVTASNSFNGQPESEAEGRAYLYALVYTENGDSTYYASEPVAPQTEGCTEAYNNYTATFKVPANASKVVIGMMSAGEMAARWFVCDNFTLEYYGKESAKELDTKNGEIVNIKDAAEQAKATVVAIYSAAGQKISKLQKGINIVKMSDMSVKKVMVK